VACSHEVTTGRGEVPRGRPGQEGAQAGLAAAVRRAGAKGHRFYDWAVIDLANPDSNSRQLLIRRNRGTAELAYYRCCSPTPVPLTELVRVAGSRWRVEEFFQSGKGLAGLDEHQVRRYASWSRRVTVAMLGHAFLACSSARTNTSATLHRTASEKPYLNRSWDVQVEQGSWRGDLPAVRA
jgi:hypothetical protein